MPVVLLAPIAAVILALMAVLLIWGAQAMRDVLSRVFEHVPAIGGRIASGVRDGFNLAIGAAQAVLDPMIAPLWRAISGPVAWAMKMIDTGVGVIHAVHNTLDRIVHYWVPAQLAHLRHYAEQLYNRAVAYAKAEVGALRHYAEQLYNLAHAYADAVAGAVLREAQALYNRAIAYTLSEVTALRHYAEQLYNLAHAYAAELAGAVLAEAQHLVALARSYAAELVAAAESRLLARIAQVEGEAVTLAREAEHAAVVAVDSAAAAAVGAVWPDVVAGVRAVEGVIGTDLPDIGAALRDIDLSVPGDLLAVLAGVGALSVPMLRYMEKCGIPNCRNLSQFGRDLAALEDIVGGGALLALLVELAHDPEAVARETVDVLGGVTAGTVHAFRDLIGV